MHPNAASVSCQPSASFGATRWGGIAATQTNCGPQAAIALASFLVWANFGSVTIPRPFPLLSARSAEGISDAKGSPVAAPERRFVSSPNADRRVLNEQQRNFVSMACASLTRRQLAQSDVKTALRAIIEAMVFLRNANPPRVPNVVSVAEDGFLSLQWKNGDSGLLVTFSGAGGGAYSLKRPGKRYSTEVIEFNTSQPRTPELESAIRAA